MGFEIYDDYDKKIESLVGVEVEVSDDKGYPEKWGGPKGGINKGDRGTIIAIDKVSDSSGRCGVADVLVKFGDKGEYCYNHRNLKINANSLKTILNKHKETNITNQQVFEKYLEDLLFRIGNKFRNPKLIENQLFEKLNQTITNYENEIKKQIGFF